MPKAFDLAVKTGEYQKDGQTKGRYENIGIVVQNEDGSQYILLKRTFNPAGVHNPENRDTVLVSMFAPRESGPQSEATPPAQRSSLKDTQAPNMFPNDLNDDCPF